MATVKEYAYVMASSAVGILLILTGAIGFWYQLVALSGDTSILFSFLGLYPFAFNTAFNLASLAFGIATLRQRARALAALYCLLSALAELLRWGVGQGYGFPFYLQHQFY